MLKITKIKMINIDNISIIISVVLLFLALLSPIINPFFRKPKQMRYGGFDADNLNQTTEECDDNDDEEEVIHNTIQKNLTPISIIFTPNNDAESLSRNLELYLNQNHCDFQVIVVAPKGDTETEDILKSHSSNPRLYTTFIPSSSKYMSRKKLAITLGVKAAKNEWVMIADISCMPQSDKWLSTLACHCRETNNLVVGYTKFEDDAPSFWKFERLQTTLYLIREYQKGMPYGCNSNALLFRKSDFIEQDGFRGNLKFIRGEYDFIINKYGRKGTIDIDLSKYGTLIEQTPPKKLWVNKHLYYMESRKHLRRSFRHRLLFNLDQSIMHVSYLTPILVLSYSLLKEHWFLTIVAMTALFVTIILRTFIGDQAIKQFEEDIPAWKIVPYELRIIWQNLSYKIKYWRANKYDFISHKI